MNDDVGKRRKIISPENDLRKDDEDVQVGIILSFAWLS